MSKSDSEDSSIRERIKTKFCSHDWRFCWADRTKTCRECGTTQPIEKEYTHEDESADIGDTRIVVRESDERFTLCKERYSKTAQGPDSVYFQWFPSSGSLYVDEEGLLEVQDQISQVLDEDVDQSKGDSSAE